MLPRLKRSDCPETFFSRACSGESHAADPTMVPLRVILGSLADRATPKSEIFAVIWPFVCSSIFMGFRSR